MSPTDPRAQRSRAAIVAAAQRLLVQHGPVAVTHARVAEEAQVGRATVYRHWPRGEDLLTEAMAGVPLPFFAAAELPTRGWLRAELVELSRQLELDEVRAVTTTLASAAQWDPAIDARRERLASVLVDRVARALSAAEARGEVRLALAASDAAALLIGPLYYRSTIERGAVGSSVVDAALNALGRWAS